MVHQTMVRQTMVDQTMVHQTNMFLNLFLKELHLIVFKHLHLIPVRVTDSSLIQSGFQCLQLSLTSKSFYKLLKNTSTILSRMFILYNKYSKYNYDYEDPCTVDYFGINYNFDAPPILIDALNSGSRYPVLKYSHSKIDVNDVMEIVRLFPGAMNSNLGSMRCRLKITPFVAAVYNVNVDEQMLIFLLQNGADPFKKYLLSFREIDILEDIKDNDIGRYNLLLKVLTKLCLIK